MSTKDTTAYGRSQEGSKVPGAVCLRHELLSEKRFPYKVNGFPYIDCLSMLEALLVRLLNEEIGHEKIGLIFRASVTKCRSTRYQAEGRENVVQKKCMFKE